MDHAIDRYRPDNVMPDSRLSVISTPRGAFPGSMGFMVPIYCASCGVEGGAVPEENMTFAFWLCDKRLNGCFEKYGEIAGMMAVPDQVFWQKVRQEQVERYGRELGFRELADIVAADASPLATLIKQGR